MYDGLDYAWKFALAMIATIILATAALGWIAWQAIQFIDRVGPQAAISILLVPFILYGAACLCEGKILR